MEKEYIIETTSGALYQINYKKSFNKPATATLFQLKSIKVKCENIFYKIFKFGDVIIASSANKPNLKEFIVGNQVNYIVGKNGLGKTSPISKIYIRI